VHRRLKRNGAAWKRLPKSNKVAHVGCGEHAHQLFESNLDSVPNLVNLDSSETMVQWKLIPSEEEQILQNI